MSHSGRTMPNKTNRRTRRRARAAELLNKCSRITARLDFQALRAHEQADFCQFLPMLAKIGPNSATFRKLANLGQAWPNSVHFLARIGKTWPKAPCPRIRNVRKSRQAVRFEHLFSNYAARARRLLRWGEFCRVFWGHSSGHPPRACRVFFSAFSVYFSGARARTELGRLVRYRAHLSACSRSVRTSTVLRVAIDCYDADSAWLRGACESHRFSSESVLAMVAAWRDGPSCP